MGAAGEDLTELRARARQPVDPEDPPQGVESLLEYQESCQKWQSPHVCVVQDGQHLEPGTAEYDNMVFKKMVCTMSVWISQSILDEQQDDFLKVQAEILAPAWRLDARKRRRSALQTQRATRARLVIHLIRLLHTPILRRTVRTAQRHPIACRKHLGNHP